MQNTGRVRQARLYRSSAIIATSPQRRAELLIQIHVSIPTEYTGNDSLVLAANYCIRIPVTGALLAVGLRSIMVHSASVGSVNRWNCG